MFTLSTIRTTFGLSIVRTRATVRVMLTQHELLAVIKQIERDVEEAHAYGDDPVATRLDWRAADLREATR